jgi:3-methyladenine DNA glycosylase/8-oxoguanine DNA glycosylase
MRAIGASSGAIARLFVGEGLLLGWLSWLLAMPLSIPAGWLMTQALGAAEELNQIGFSRQKTRYGRELANAILDGSLDLSSLGKLEDQEAKEQLMKVKGIGPWTADIYLLMALGRPDIWPRGDLALEVAIQRVKGWLRRPTPEEMRKMSDEWQPWRAVAARLLWHFYLCERKKGVPPKCQDRIV